jgi:hypothetical protein
MNRSKIVVRAEKIFKMWGLEGHVLDDDEFVEDIKTAIQEAYIEGYGKGIAKCEKEINKLKNVDLLFG